MPKKTPSERGRPASVLATFTRFLRGRSGNVAMMFGLAAIPFFTMGGMAVDFSRAMMVKNRLSTALDATALALGSQVGLSQQQVRRQAQAYFNANYPASELGTPSELNITYGSGTVTISASAAVPTVVIGLVGVDELNVAADVTVNRSSTSIEVALVLDITGSMAGSKIRDLRAAANDLVDIVVQDEQTPFFSKVALVPYSSAVNVGAFANAVRGAASASYTFMAQSNTTQTFALTTCATERTGAQAYSDVAPATAPVGRQYAKASNPSHPCPAARFVPMTDNRTTLHNAINALSDGGSTAGQIGIAWGWYALSPNFASVWGGLGAGKPYGTEDLAKIAVIMTDGEFNTAYCNGVVGTDSGISNSERAKNCSPTNGTPFAQAAQLCTKMKEKLITIYTVAFAVTAGSAEATALQNCATSPSHYKLASNGEDLRNAFREIAIEISNLRISH